MNREIPGFYYDTAKRKYFRIENSRTAPTQAAWSSQNVKRRAVEEKEDEARRARARREAQRVKRWRARDVPLLGGLLAREAGERCPEILARAWAGGLREKGSLEPWPVSRGKGGTVSALWAGGSDERSGLGVAYTVMDESFLVASYVPRNVDDRIDFGSSAERYPRVSFRPTYYYQALRDVKSVKFHAPSNRMLLACKHSLNGIGIQWINPRSQSPSDSEPAWVLPGDDDDQSGYGHSALSHGTAETIHALQTAPRGSQLTCVAGTDRGIIQLQDDKLTWLTPYRPSRKKRSYQSRKQQQQGGPPDPGPAPWQGDILSVDFLQQHHRQHPSADVVLAGTRSSHVCVLDLRVPPREWTERSNTFRHASSAAHVRAVAPFEVLAAGPRNAMAVYDVRFLQQQGSSSSGGGGLVRQWNGNATRPLVTFPSYRNEAHIQTGLDVLTDPPGYGERGIVAAAHDDGAVGLYSLRDGRRLPAGDVDGIRAGAVVRSVMWQTLPGDRHPSLFVGEGPAIRKYSFWA